MRPDTITRARVMDGRTLMPTKVIMPTLQTAERNR